MVRRKLKGSETKKVYRNQPRSLSVQYRMFIGTQYPKIASSIDERTQKSGFLSKIAAYLKGEVVVATISTLIVLFGTAFQFSQYIKDEKNFKNNERLQQIGLFNETLKQIADFRATGSSNNIIGMSFLQDRVSKFAHDYPNDVSASDLLFVAQSTNFGTNNESVTSVLESALRKSNKEFPLNTLRIVAAKWYLASNYLQRRVNRKKADELFEQVWQDLKSGKNDRYRAIYLQIHFDRAQTFRNLNDYDECMKEWNLIENDIRQNPQFVDSKTVNDSYKALWGCRPIAIIFKQQKHDPSARH